MDGSPRILISRMSAIGDCILTLPVACAIRRQFPTAYIGWVVEKKSAPMVRDHHAIDAVIELDRGWFTSIKGVREAKQTLLSHDFDTSIDCQGLTKSAMAGYLSGAQRAGVFTRDRPVVGTADSVGHSFAQGPVEIAAVDHRADLG
jgi:ADP-heptose:LPS heptosyltransferase